MTGGVQGKVAERYTALESDRNAVLNRGRRCAELTIPALLPESGANETTSFKTPAQSVGARGVNNLAAKLTISLFPPNVPPLKMQIDELTLEQLTGQEGARAEVDKALAKIEKKVLNWLQTQAIHVAVAEILKQLLIAGNVLVYLPPSGGVRMFRLDKYVVRRDPMGRVLEIVVKEGILRETLPDALVEELAKTANTDQGGAKKPSDVVDAYTYVVLKNKTYHVWQEVEGIEVPGSRGTFPQDKTPWLALRLYKVDGEHYGRSYVEEYFGDLQALENLSESLDDFAEIAAMVKFGVRPGSPTRPTTLEKTKNGGFFQGTKDDIWVLQLDKYADMRVVLERVNNLEQRLAFAFLLNTAIQRPGERVTAEEIRYMARELDDTLGGVYSLLALEFQLPFVRRVLHQLQRERELPPLPPQVKPVIVTGLEAIGRGQDSIKLTRFVGAIAQTPGAEYINWGDFTTRLGTAEGIDMGGLVKSEEEVQQARQAAMQAQMMSQVAPNAVNQIGNVIKEGMKNGASAQG